MTLEFPGQHPILQQGAYFQYAPYADLTGFLRRAEDEYNNGIVRYLFMVFRPEDLSCFSDDGHETIRKSLITPVIMTGSFEEMRMEKIEETFKEGLDNNPHLRIILVDAVINKFDTINIVEIHNDRRAGQTRKEREAREEQAHLSAKQALKPIFKFRLKPS